jgi:hypothetical protein
VSLNPACKSSAKKCKIDDVSYLSYQRHLKTALCSAFRINKSLLPFNFSLANSCQILGMKFYVGIKLFIVENSKYIIKVKFRL